MYAYGPYPRLCAARGAQHSDFAKRIWLCPVALGFSQAVEAQLNCSRATQSPLLGAEALIPGQYLMCCQHFCGPFDGGHPGLKPHPDLNGMVWDMVCLATMHGTDVGCCTAWGISIMKLTCIASCGCRADSKQSSYCCCLGWEPQDPAAVAYSLFYCCWSGCSGRLCRNCRYPPSSSWLPAHTAAFPGLACTDHAWRHGCA